MSIDLLLTGLSAIAIVSFGLAAVRAARLPRARLGFAPQIFLMVCLWAYAFVATAHLLELTTAYRQWDSFDEYIELLFIPLFLFFLFARHMEMQVERLRRAQAAQREAESYYRAIVESTPDLICRYRADTTLVFANEAFCRYFNRVRADVLDRSFLDFAARDERPPVGERTRARFDTGEARSLEYATVRADGETRWHAWYTQPLPDAAGRVTAVQAMGRDITDTRRAAAERETLIGELEARNTELERFAYTVSHDLKTPLITIRGFLGYIDEDARSGDLERMAKDMQRVVDATSKMQRMLDELLMLSRTGRQAAASVELPFDVIAQEAVSLVAGRLTARNIRVEIEPNLPAVCGDRIRLMQVVENLVDNAAKFMGDQPAPCIRIGARRGGPRPPVFTVSDNGIGIDPRYQARVFGLFDKLDPRSEGTGIGLALVKRIVEAHGGRIWVESEGAGKGSTFCLTLGQPPAS
ncbi:MAG: PAS domain-containing sensor histidine kinase [Chloroflexi bacterium]|nr:PAS domain-containing sensor histidine kinase [Chloroflexota bacterium]